MCGWLGARMAGLFRCGMVGARMGGMVHENSSTKMTSFRGVRPAALSHLECVVFVSPGLRAASLSPRGPNDRTARLQPVRDLNQCVAHQLQSVRRQVVGHFEQQVAHGGVEAREPAPARRGQRDNENPAIRSSWRELQPTGALKRRHRPVGALTRNACSASELRDTGLVAGLADHSQHAPLGDGQLVAGAQSPARDQEPATGALERAGEQQYLAPPGAQQ